MNAMRCLVLALWALQGAAQEKAPVAEMLTAAPGGLCVQLGCGDGRLTAELGRSGKFLVHALDSDAEQVARTREHLQSQGLYGRVSADRSDLTRLPYADNLVNLIVVQDLGRLLKDGLALSDVMRVLCPNGTAWVGGLGEPELKARLAAAGIQGVRQSGPWARFAKPWPSEMGEWTHRVHVGADGNPRVKPGGLGQITSLRWLAGPIWPLGEHQGIGLSGAASARGRNFCITSHVVSNFRTAPEQRPKSYFLTARDAFNGLLLWQRPVGEPPVFPLLIAEGERVYTALGKEGPLVSLDAATGEVVRTYDTIPFPRGLVYSKPSLFAFAWGPLQCLDAESGAVRWTYGQRVGKVLVGDGAIYCQDGSSVSCLDAATGQERWKKREAGEPLFYQAGFLALIRVLDPRNFGQGRRGKREFIVCSAKTGEPAWTRAFQEGYGGGEVSAGFANSLIWTCEAAPQYRARWMGFEPATGEVKKQVEFPMPASTTSGCMDRQWVLTDRYAYGAHTLTMIDLEGGGVRTTPVARGGCGVGYMAGNGLLNTFPKSCACYTAMLRGYTAFGSDPEPDGEDGRAVRFAKGPAWGTDSEGPAAGPEDWPTYRHDAARSAAVATALPAEPKPLWEAALTDPGPKRLPLEQEWVGNPYGDSRLSQPVVAEGKVLVSLREAHRVVALDVGNGKPLWSFTAGGRLDSPPTVHAGRVLLGCRDGWVYCLRSRDGQLVWRFRAAPVERRIMAFGQLESPWPVTGGVLVENGAAYCFAGRTTEIDGGIWGYALDPATGRVLWQARSRTPKEAKEDRYLGIADMPVSIGSYVSMGGKWPRDLKSGDAWGQRGHSALGAVYTLLDRSWQVMAVSHLPKTCQMQWHNGLVWGAWGQLLAADADRVVTYRMSSANGSHLGFLPKGHKNAETPTWRHEFAAPQQVEGLILAKDRILAAGCVDRLDRSKGGMLWAISSTDGAKLGEWKLPAPPVPEGLAAAGGRLYLCTEDGRVRCWGK